MTYTVEATQQEVSATIELPTEAISTEVQDALTTALRRAHGPLLMNNRTGYPVFTRFVMRAGAFVEYGGG